MQNQPPFLRALERSYLWWLSFVDTDAPDEEDHEWLGICILEAGDDVASAVQRAWTLGINPGGEVCGVKIVHAPLCAMNRLVTDEMEARNLAAGVKALSECDA
jgi:hypothetical protein